MLLAMDAPGRDSVLGDPNGAVGKRYKVVNESLLLLIHSASNFGTSYEEAPRRVLPLKGDAPVPPAGHPDEAPQEHFAAMVPVLRAVPLQLDAPPLDLAHEVLDRSRGGAAVIAGAELAQQVRLHLSLRTLRGAGNGPPHEHLPRGRPRRRAPPAAREES